MNSWTAWPLQEALSREGRPAARRSLGRGVRLVLFGGATWWIVAKGGLNSWQTALAVLGLAVGYAMLRAYFRVTLHHRLWPAVGLIALLIAGVASPTCWTPRSAGSWCGAAARWCPSNGCRWPQGRRWPRCR